MSAVAYLWPETGRLEAWGAFGTVPTLEARGQADAVGDLYTQMHKRGELALMGQKTVPMTQWLRRVLGHVEGEHIAAIVADRFKQSEIGDALGEIGNRAPVMWRGMGFKDGSEDVERFRRFVFDGNLHVSESLLLRHAIGEARCSLIRRATPKSSKAVLWGGLMRPALRCWRCLRALGLWAVQPTREGA